MVVRDQGKVDDHCAAIGSNYLIRYFYFFQVRNEFRILWIRRDFAAFFGALFQFGFLFLVLFRRTVFGGKNWKIFFKKMGQTRPPFVYFRSLHLANIAQIQVLGTRTRGGWMVGADKSTELWRLPYLEDL